MGAFASYWLLNPDIVGENIGWRIAFLIGPVLGLGIIYLRRHIPESPRWMVTHGRGEEAERVVSAIEEKVRSEGKTLPDHDEEKDGMWIKAREGLTPSSCPTSSSRCTRRARCSARR
ncbi:MFS transporter [Janibacter melonis]|uniref:MFS transporter n=1 Tax=Janibacter melonis TaxID=262209 RepID=UPI0020965D4A|nr:MFS transporter [Janibacter melonis]